MEERPLGPFSSSVAPLSLFSTLFGQERKSLSDCFSKQAGKGGRELWRSQCRLQAGSLRKTATVLVSGTLVSGEDEVGGKGWEEGGDIG